MARPPRIPGYSYTGPQRYFLTICTHKRAPHLRDADLVALVVGEFLRPASELGMAILVYCVMPDHLHLLVEGISDAADFKEFVSRAKQRSAWRFKCRCGRRLWQEGFWEHVLRDSERVEALIEYIVNNPLRKKLVEKPEDYPFWGSTVHDRNQILRFIGYASHRRRT